jgi:hypothetical protein
MSKFGDLLQRQTTAPAPKVEAAPAPEPVVEEAPVVEEDAVKVLLEELSKDELEAYGRDLGVELDKRHSKKNLIEELKEIEE